MKTCEACWGTGQVREIITGGMIVEGITGRLTGITGIVVGKNTQLTYNMLNTFLDLKTGESWSFKEREVRIRHGYFHYE